MTLTWVVFLTILAISTGWALYHYNSAWKSDQDKLIGRRGSPISHVDFVDEVVADTVGSNYVDYYFRNFLELRSEPAIVTALKSLHRADLQDHNFSGFQGILNFLEYLDRNDLAMQVVLDALKGGYFSEGFKCTSSANCNPVENWKVENKQAATISESFFEYVLPQLIDQGSVYETCAQAVKCLKTIESERHV